MSDLTPSKLDELRRLAATAADATTERTPWYSADDLLAYGVESEDDASYFAALTPSTVLALRVAATELAHMREARDNARAEVERLTALVEAVREDARDIARDSGDDKGCYGVDFWAGMCKAAARIDGRIRHALDGEADRG